MTADVAKLRGLVQLFLQSIEVDPALVHTLDYVELCSLINAAPALLDACEERDDLRRQISVCHV